MSAVLGKNIVMMSAILTSINFLCTLFKKIILRKNWKSRKNHLVTFCSLPDSQKKIAEISVGILRKNSNLSKKITALDSQIKNFTSQINHLYHQLASLKKVLPKENSNTFYKIRSSPNLNPLKNILDIASTIADAFLGDSNAVYFVNANIFTKIFSEKM